MPADKPGKENLDPVNTEVMSDSKGKRKADSSKELSQSKKRKAVAEADLDDVDSLRADNEELRARFEELSAAFDDLRHLRYTEPEKAIKDLLAKSQEVQRGLETAVREHKEEVKRLRRGASPTRRVSPPAAGSRKGGKADEEALAHARAEGAAEAEGRIQGLEEQLLDVQTRFAAEKKKQRQKTTASEPTEAPDNYLDMLSDLSGLTILHHLENPREDIVQEYRILLSDLQGKGISLYFRLDEHPDETISYTPELNEDRDEAVLELLVGKSAVLRGFLRFNRRALPSFSRRLLFAVNGRSS